MRPTRSTVTAVTALAVAAVTAVSSSVALAMSRGTPDPVGFEVVTSAPAAGGAPPPAVTGHASQGAQPDRRNDPGPPTPAPPTQISIPALGVAAPVMPTGVTKAGNAEIPSDGDDIGWYEFGSTPGDTQGSAVLIGHRDTQAEGPGALFELDRVQAGDLITVRAGSVVQRYTVVALRSVDKAGLPASLFRRSGPPQLVVITCGGPYVADEGGYQENLFAIAVPEER